MTTPTQADRDAAAGIWRDFVARPGECIAERAIRAGEMDNVPLVQTLARHREQAERETVKKIVTWLRGQHDPYYPTDNHAEHWADVIQSGEWKA